VGSSRGIFKLCVGGSKGRLRRYHRRTGDAPYGRGSPLLLLERLSDSDLAVLAKAAGEPRLASANAPRLRSDPALVGELIDRPQTYRSLFESRERDHVVVATPFLAFSVLLAQAARELRGASFVEEWTGPGRRLPVFDIDSLTGFIGEDMRRLFLAELLSSYTHVASGTVWARSGGRWRRRKFSELDPVQLARLAVEVPDWERLAVYRRLGDLALFLTGVFPDYAGTWLDRSRFDRMERALGMNGEHQGTEDGSAYLLERVGRRAYELTAAGAGSPATVGMVGVIAELPARFGEARRVLNFLTDRHLFPKRERWFPLP
jgi:hypothetical protein